MENNKGKISKLKLPVTLAVASVLFGWHAGGGFASGNQANQFFIITGWLGPFSAILAILLLTLTIRQAMIMYNQNKLKNYKQLFQKLYHPFSKLEIVFEIYFYVMILMAISASIAGAGKLFEDVANIPYVLAVIIVGVILLILTMFGADLVRKASTIMSVVILICAVTIFIFGITQKSFEISIIAAEGPTLSQLPTALLKSFQYAGFQSAAIPAMIAVGVVLTSWKASKKSMWISFVMNSVALTLSVVMLLGWKDVYSAIDGGSVIPTLTVTKELNVGILTWAYYVCLFLCFISTGVTAIFGVVGRFRDSKLLMKINSAPGRSATLSFVIMLIAMVVSFAGLTNIVKYGYGYCGYIGIAFIVIPFLTVGVYKNRKFRKEHPELSDKADAEKIQ